MSVYPLYTGMIAELPIEKIAGLGNGAKFVVHREGDRIASYEYSGADLTVSLSVMPGHELPDHLR